MSALVPADPPSDSLPAANFSLARQTPSVRLVCDRMPAGALRHRSLRQLSDKAAGSCYGVAEPATVAGSMADTSAKEMAIEAIQALPAEADLEQVMDRLFFVLKVERGLDALNAGDTVAHEEVIKRLGRWRE